MFILIIPMIIVAFWKKQGMEYWRAIAISAVLQGLAVLLFTKDTGLISRVLGEEYWYISLLSVIVIAWVIPYMLHRKYYKKTALNLE